MLYKNGEQYKLAPNDIKQLLNEFGKFPLAIIYPPERIVKSRSSHNRLPDKPNSISFPLLATVKTPTGAEQWRYADNEIIKEHGVKRYTPRSFRFHGRHPLQETDAELAWFLFTKSPYCKGGKNQGKTIKFMFENLRSDADKRADQESLRTKVKALIYGEDFGLSEDKMRLIAKAYFIRNVDSLTFSQVKIAIEDLINKDKDGLRKFIEMTNMDEYLKIRSRLQSLMDSGKMKYDGAKKEWQWINERGEKIDLICKTAPGAVPNNTLYDYFMGNRNFQEEVEAVETSGKVEAM